MASSSDNQTAHLALIAPRLKGGHLIREARLRSGISQSELARRMGTSQSLVARWEANAVSPRYESLVRAVRACGLDLSVGVATYDFDHDNLIDEQLKLSPESRAVRMVDHVRNVQRLQREARRER